MPARLLPALPFSNSVLLQIQARPKEGVLQAEEHLHMAVRQPLLRLRLLVMISLTGKKTGILYQPVRNIVLMLRATETSLRILFYSNSL